MTYKKVVRFHLTIGTLLLVLLTNCTMSLKSTNGVHSVNSSTAESALPSPNAPTAIHPTSAPPSLNYDDFTEAMGQLDRTLATREQETYAGLCIIKPGKREAAIAFTSNAEETAHKYLADQPYEMQVQVWTADYPKAFLDKNLQDEMQRFIDLGFYAIGSVDNCKNRILISVVSITDLEAALQAADITLPGYVELMEESMVTLEP